MTFDPSYKEKALKSVGTRPLRPDGVDKVTGRARYGADFNMPGQLIARVLRSPHAHARIVRIDTSQAEALKGVKAVITAADIPDQTNGDGALFAILDNCMARTKAKYDGHAVAAVAAIDATVARAALKLIDIEYEVLPHVVEVDEATKPDAPLIDETIFTTGVDPAPTKPSNVANRAEFGHGDVEAGFAQADAIVERTYKTEQTHQGYIEPHACVANCNSDGTADLWVCTQGHFVFRQTCADLLGLEVSKLRVTSSEIGGGFGGKTHVWAEPVALALSRKAGRPVKLVMSREEVFRASGPTSATSIDVKIGATKDGKITAAEATLRYSSGPYPNSWAETGAMTSFACYDLENVKTVGFEVVVNRPKVAAYRAPSAPMAAFAVESAIDELAHAVKIDPLDLRIKNAAKEGSRSSYGPIYGPIGIGPTLDAAKTHPHMNAPLGKNQGRGMACGFWFNFGGQTCSDLNISADGTVALAVGTVDVGGSRASLSLIAAEELGIDYQDVKAVIADTASLGYNDMTDGSRGTFSSSMATISAARNAIKTMRERAALMWDIPVEDVVWEEGHARAVGSKHGNRAPLSVKDIAAEAGNTGG
ncbi:MAG TPA: oxidoreductase, partial [Octadecabacter sp.]|nr:oxidoreductase [Octadecabacter sp.]